MQSHPNPFKPELPIELVQLYANDERLQSAHEEMAKMDLETIMSNQLPLQNDGISAGYIDIPPIDSQDYDQTSALIIPFHYQAGWDAPNTIRMELLRRSLDTPRRIIVFPNDTYKHHCINLSPLDYPKISKGDFSPLADKYFSTLDKLGIERFSLFGYSQGAAVGAAALSLAAEKGYFAVETAGLVDPANTLRRTVKNLKESFRSTGLNRLNKAIKSSGIPAFAEAEHATDWRELEKELNHLALYEASSHFEPSQSIKQGFTHPEFSSDLVNALINAPSLKTLIVNPEDSRIMTPDSVKELKQAFSIYGDRVTWQSITGYGHEIGHNLIAYVLLGKMAIDTQTNIAC
jgi:hypothetical protein